MTASTRPIIILGPTAGGKSELAAALAQLLRGQVISADSMQVYRHLDAGTAKPSQRQRAMALHHLVDVVEPTEPFTVADWLTKTEGLIATLGEQGQRAILVGGTNLYLRTFLEGMFDGPPANAALREQLAQQSNEQLAQTLMKIDPPAAERIHVNDRKRLIRAIEVYETTGKPLSQMQQQWDAPPAQPPAQPPDHQGDDPIENQTYRHDPILIGLQWPTEAINARINLRVKAMFHPRKVDADLAADVCPKGESLPEETARLLATEMFGPQARKALGYQQVIDAIQGRGSMDDAYEKTKVQTRRFAKSQRTWLKRFRGVHWLAADKLGHDAMLENCLNHVRNADAKP